MTEPLTRPLNRRQLAKIATKQKVTDAARELFTDRGYAAATIRDIAKAAGMSTGAVFANFLNKAAVWSGVYGGPAPDLALADEVARLQGAFPNATWAVGFNGARHFAMVNPPEGAGLEALADTPAEALRLARLAALELGEIAQLGEAA